MRLDFVPRRLSSAAILLTSRGEDRHFYRLANRTQHIWFDHEKQAAEFARAFLDGRLDPYHRRLPIYIPDEDLLPGLWLYTNTQSVTSNPGVSQNYTFSSSWTTTNLVEGIGGGGGGQGAGVGASAGGGGGGGGTYAQYQNLLGYNPNTTTTVHVGSAGVGSTNGGTPQQGGNTWFGASTFGASPLVGSGGNQGSGANGGGPRSGSNGTAINNGGTGGNGTSTPTAGAGAGAGGAFTGGGNGIGTTPGAAGGGALQDGSTAGAGAAPGHTGSNYGGAGGGANQSGTGGGGGQGIFVISWTVGSSATGLGSLLITG